MWSYYRPLNRSFPLPFHLLFITFIDLPTPTIMLCPTYKRLRNSISVSRKLELVFHPNITILYTSSEAGCQTMPFDERAPPYMTQGLVTRRGDPREIESMTAESQRNWVFPHIQPIQKQKEKSSITAIAAVMKAIIL